MNVHTWLNRPIRKTLHLPAVIYIDVHESKLAKPKLLDGERLPLDLVLADIASGGRQQR
eukprot:COSAG01_NODE_63750_length_279_cov_0.316667_1_plen_58_part_10